MEEGKERSAAALATEITERLPGLSAGCKAVTATQTAKCQTMVANIEHARTQEADQDAGLCLSEHALCLLWY